MENKVIDEVSCVLICICGMHVPHLIGRYAALLSKISEINFDSFRKSNIYEWCRVQENFTVHQTSEDKFT